MYLASALTTTPHHNVVWLHSIPT